jgi:hypothetical protein
VKIEPENLSNISVVSEKELDIMLPVYLKTMPSKGVGEWR